MPFLSQTFSKSGMVRRLPEKILKTTRFFFAVPAQGSSRRPGPAAPLFSLDLLADDKFEAQFLLPCQFHLQLVRGDGTLE